MRENYDKGFELTIGLEGKPSDDPDDPGGFTIWGLAKKYHPWITKNTTIDEAKPVYLKKYWIPAGCDDVKFPMDICLFDAAVNPQDDPTLPDAGNKELLNLGPDNWQEFLLMRMCRYMRRSKPVFVKGHLFRVLNIYDALKKMGV